MNEESKNKETKLASAPETGKINLLSGSIFISAIILAGAWVYTGGYETVSRQKLSVTDAAENAQISELEKLEEKVLPSEGVVLPVTWGDLGAKLVGTGVIDAEKFKAIYQKQSSFTDEYENLLFGQNNGRLKITKDNAGYLLNLFWALGLANKNPILETGEMVNPAYGGAQNFASTGGWTIAKGGSMSHYSRHEFFTLTPEQQVLVDKMSRGIYRPCCGNSTHFPDCNHGMAMLGLLELMASQGVGEKDMWKAALAVNSYWFPDTYLTIAGYLKSKGINWSDANPQEILGRDYSSSSGYKKILSEITVPTKRSGESCSI